jgi:hypothetical protein
MFSKGLPRNPRELRISSIPRGMPLIAGRYVNPRDDRREHGWMAEQSYNSIVPVKVVNRRASARSGHGSH